MNENHYHQTIVFPSIRSVFQRKPCALNYLAPIMHLDHIQNGGLLNSVFTTIAVSLKRIEV